MAKELYYASISKLFTDSNLAVRKVNVHPYNEHLFEYGENMGWGDYIGGGYATEAEAWAALKKHTQKDYEKIMRQAKMWQDAMDVINANTRGCVNLPK